MKTKVHLFLRAIAVYYFYFVTVLQEFRLKFYYCCSTQFGLGRARIRLATTKRAHHKARCIMNHFNNNTRYV